MFTIHTKFFAYLNWRAVNAEKNIVILHYHDACRLHPSRSRFDKAFLESFYKRSCKEYKYGGVIVDSSGHSQLVVSSKPINLDELSGNFFHRKVFGDFLKLVESYSQVMDITMKSKVEGTVPFWKARALNTNFIRLELFESQHA